MKQKTYSILIVDDDRAHRTMLRTLASGWGYGVTEAADGAEAIELVGKGPFDLVLMDIRMAVVSGLEALGEIKALNPSIPVILMTAYASVDTAVEALKKGAYDYLLKPLNFDELKIALGRAVEHSNLRIENLRLKDDMVNMGNIIGGSEKMKKLLDTVRHIAPTEATVLLTGESGTGKELIVSAIHYNSPRSAFPFIKINCAALTETLLESELFGHERGAFTGADRRKEGKFKQADHGTLFLDEVSEMSLAMQVKLLRVLQERELTRVGGEEVIKVDVRLIAATNRDLRKEIEAGRFRDDLFYRLNVITLHVPALRERKEDIPLLAHHYLGVFAEKNRKPIKGFTPQAMDHLIRYDWPGNVRELMNSIERGVVLARGEYLDASDLELEAGQPAPASLEIRGGMPLEDVEKAAIIGMLGETEGNKSEAARRLGITRRTLHQKLKKFGLM